MYLKLSTCSIYCRNSGTLQWPLAALHHTELRLEFWHGSSLVISIISCKVQNLYYPELTKASSWAALLKPYVLKAILRYYRSLKHAPPPLSFAQARQDANQAVVLTFDICVMYYRTRVFFSSLSTKNTEKESDFLLITSLVFTPYHCSRSRFFRFGSGYHRISAVNNGSIYGSWQFAKYICSFIL
jgi:hypothetical protein